MGECESSYQDEHMDSEADASQVAEFRLPRTQQRIFPALFGNKKERYMSSYPTATPRPEDINIKASYSCSHDHPDQRMCLKMGAI